MTRWVAVYDTNILISALLSLRGSPFRCLALARAGTVELVTCEDILREFVEKLSGKLSFPLVKAQAAADEVRTLARVVPTSGQVAGATADPDDDMVLECAVIGGATHIVTGDRRHLLPLRSYQGIAIVTTAEFLEIVSRGQERQGT